MVPLTSVFAEKARNDALALEAESRALEADARSQEMESRRASLRATMKGLELALPSADESTKVAREAFDAIETRAKGGLARELEVESARLTLIRAQTTAASLRVRADAARARLAWLGG